MTYDLNTARAVYKKLINLYPRGFRERLGESMQQTFNDRYNEQKRLTQHRLFGFLLWIFVETTIGIVQEHLIVVTEGDIMKNMLANPRLAAITSFILALPLGLMYIAFMFDIQPLIKPLKALLTTNGSDLNNFGRLVLFGGLLLLPIAFALNLQPSLKKIGPEGKRIFYAINIIVGAAILLLIIFTWGGLIMESIYCLQGIRCD